MDMPVIKKAVLTNFKFAENIILSSKISSPIGPLPVVHNDVWRDPTLEESLEDDGQPSSTFGTRPASSTSDQPATVRRSSKQNSGQVEDAQCSENEHEEMDINADREEHYNVAPDVPYPLFHERNVTCFPPEDKKVQVYKMTLDNIRYAHVVFDNLAGVKQKGDPPFFMGRLSDEEMPQQLTYKQVAFAFNGSKHINCNYNLLYCEAEIKRMAKKPTKKTGRKGKRGVNDDVAADDEEDDGAFLVQTVVPNLPVHALNAKVLTRKCSLYLMSEIFEGNEVRAIENLGLSKFLDVAGVLPALCPFWTCISSVGFLVSEKRHVLGFHRENNLFCSVNLLFVGHKRWTFIDPLANDNFQLLSVKLARKSNLPSELKNCSDPTQHKKFAMFFDDSRSSEVRYVVDQYPGDIIFIPSNVYHQVEVIESSVAIAFNTVDSEWTKQNVEDFYKHCPNHDALSQFPNLPQQRAAYSILPSYAKMIKKCFLDQSILHPNNEELIKIFTATMRALAIKDDLRLSDNGDEEADKVSQEITQEAGQQSSTGETIHNNVVTSTEKQQHSNNAPVFPNYDGAFGVQHPGKVIITADAMFQCRKCKYYFVTAKEARYHCDPEVVTCSYCEKTLASVSNKQFHELTCKKNPSVIKEMNKKMDEKKKQAEVEFLKRFEGSEIPPEGQRRYVPVKCIHCGVKFQYGLNGCGIKQHETYCPKNETGFERAKRGTGGGFRGPKKPRLASSTNHETTSRTQEGQPIASCRGDAASQKTTSDSEDLDSVSVGGDPVSLGGDSVSLGGNTPFLESVSHEGDPTYRSEFLACNQGTFVSENRNDSPPAGLEESTD